MFFLKLDLYDTWRHLEQGHIPHLDLTVGPMISADTFVSGLTRGRCFTLTVQIFLKLLGIFIDTQRCINL